MKSKKTPISFLALCAGMLLLSTPVSAKVWPLFCKSGPSINVHINYFINSGPASIEIYYTKGSKAAGNDFKNISAGECSWPDRPMKPEERSSAVFSYGVLLGSVAPFMTVIPGNEDEPTKIMLRDSTLNSLRSNKSQKYKLFVEMQNGQLTIETVDGKPHIEFVK